VKRAILLTISVSAFALSCVKTLDPAADTGEDGEYDGSTLIELDQTLHGEIDDSVTYPGGDRVDWYSVDVGKTMPGTLTVTLSWEGPRNGADLSYKVYAAWGDKLGEQGPRKHPPNRKRGHKEGNVRPAFDTVYIEVYASRPSDAGDYTVKVAFIPDKPKFEIPDAPYPPTLSAVYPKCTPDNWDKENPDCKEMHVPDPSIKAPEPTPCDLNHPDYYNQDCHIRSLACDIAAIDCSNVNCMGLTEEVQPLLADVVAGPDADGTGSVFTVNVGTDKGVAKEWTGYLVDSQQAKVENTDLKLKKLKKTATDYKVAAKPSAITNDKTAYLFHPAKTCPVPPSTKSP
jgi:hypothetical protein